MMKLLKTLAAAAFAVVAFAGTSSAATIDLEYSNPGSDTVRATLSCTKGCEAWFISGDDYSAELYSKGFWDPDKGTIVSRGILGDGGNDNNDGTRVAITNKILGTSFSLADRSETGGSGANWTSSAQYLLVWIGTQGQPSESFRYAFIKNFAANNYFTWTGEPGGGGSKSGYDGFGVIPLPAAGWLLLAGVGGLAAMRRRKKAA